MAEARRSFECELDGKLSLWPEKVFESDDGINENRLPALAPD